MFLKYLVICVFISVPSVNCCSTGFVQYHDKCYFFSHTTASWAQAGATCQQFHTKLAEPRTVGESDFLTSHSQSTGKTYWIGISDILEEHRWIYSSDMGVITVNNFFPGEPTAHTTENCVALYMYHSLHGMWADAACVDDFYFVCEEIRGASNPEVVG
ncbi:C-type lectin domain family 17, member A-like [Ostrea edulis]|uniref:C-type lectin domain family 17, member A-like n=1 Tax=Ostrea edulis TaxID=37623 RepID=UPI0024AFAAB8|nr:C-type lectin domain family 17, member A-like [Ostrea edulis]